MINALIIVFREGFEAFITVAIILAYLRKTGRDSLRTPVYWGIAVSIAASIAMGFVLQRVNQPMWEGVLALVAAVLVASFVIHMWRVAPQMKREMEKKIDHHASKTSRVLSILGVFGFTVLMITREGMETALMLIQVRQPGFWAGCGVGLGMAAAMSWAWAHYGHRINIKRFFQVTGMFLLLFTLQILLYAVHEFSEAEILPNSEAIHIATEPWSPVGLYGKWISVGMVFLCAAWLAGVSLVDRFRSANRVAIEAR
jgi:high-affinity iron transporter